jgi:hypothetical protein
MPAQECCPPLLLDSRGHLPPCHRQEVQEKDEQYLAVAAKLDKLQQEYEQCRLQVRARPLSGRFLGCAAQHLRSRVRCAALADHDLLQNG